MQFHLKRIYFEMTKNKFNSNKKSNLEPDLNFFNHFQEIIQHLCAFRQFLFFFLYFRWYNCLFHNIKNIIFGIVFSVVPFVLNCINKYKYYYFCFLFNAEPPTKYYKNKHIFVQNLWFLLNKYTVNRLYLLLIIDHVLVNKLFIYIYVLGGK